MRVHVMSNANPIWCDPASVGRKPRSAESSLLRSGLIAPGLSRALGPALPTDMHVQKRFVLNNPPQMPTAWSGSNPARSRPFEIAAILGAPRFSPYRTLATYHT